MLWYFIICTPYHVSMKSSSCSCVTFFFSCSSMKHCQPLLGLLILIRICFKFSSLLLYNDKWNYNLATIIFMFVVFCCLQFHWEFWNNVSHVEWMSSSRRNISAKASSFWIRDSLFQRKWMTEFFVLFCFCLFTWLYSTMICII